MPRYRGCDAMKPGDVRIAWNEVELRGDMSVDPSSWDLMTDEGLETAVVVSLFSDRRAEGEDLPPGEPSKRGWWGDSLADLPGDRIGSKLWLIFREKELPSVARRAKEYASDALKWLVEDGVADRVEVKASLPEKGSGVLSLSIAIFRPGDAVKYRYNYQWNAQEVMGNGL